MESRVSGSEGARLEEVIVTARKREESLNSVPLAVSALTESQITARGLTDLTDFSTFIPSFHFQNQVGGGSGRNDRSINTLTFRGLVLANDSFTTAGGLLFVDGAPVIGGQVPPIADVERVEVLKGPQSAFFGRSTFSGAVNYVTKDPPSVFSGEGYVSYSSYNSNTEQASIGGPLGSDTLRGRVTVYHDEKGGEWTNAALPSEKFGEQQTGSISVDLLWTPVSQFRAKASAVYFVNDDGPPAQAAIKQGEMNCSLGGNLGKYYCGQIPTADHLNQGLISGNYKLDQYTYNNTIGNVEGFPTLFNPSFLRHGGLKREALQSSLIMDYTLPGGYVISSLTGFHTEKVASLLDLAFRDGSNLPSVFPTPLGIQKWLLEYQTNGYDFSQELRITSPQDKRFRWTLGGNIITANEKGGDIYGISSLFPLFGAAITKNNPTTPAVFGAVYFDILKSLTLSGELRYQDDLVRESLLTTASGAPLATPANFLQNYGSFSPRITLNYNFAEHSLVYALFSRGYRPGGFNTSLSPALGSPSVIAAAEAAAPGATLAYGQERLDNYEVGLKSLFFDGRVQVSADAYYDNYTNGQVTQSITFFTNNGTTVNQATVTRNSGAIDLDGIEGEATWQVTRQLQVNASGAFNYSKVKSGFCSDCLGIDGTNSLSGKTLLGAPRYTATLGAEYTDRLVGDYFWFARGDYAYRGKVYVDQANVAYIGPKNTLNLHLGVRNDRFSLEGFCMNCTNDLTATSATYASADVFTILVPPGTRQEIRFGLPDRRTFGVRLGANF